MFLDRRSIIVGIVLLVDRWGLRRCRAEKHCCALVWFEVGVRQAAAFITSGTEIVEGIVFLCLRLTNRRLEHDFIGILSQALWVLADLTCSDD